MHKNGRLVCALERMTSRKRKEWGEGGVAGEGRVVGQVYQSFIPGVSAPCHINSDWISNTSKINLQHYPLMSILGCGYACIFGYNACVGAFTGME